MVSIIRELTDGFKKIIKKGDVVYIHSSFNSFNKKFHPKILIQVLDYLVGDNGTLILPTYTPQFCEQFNKYGIGFYDVKNSISKMGVLTEYLRKQPDVIRTICPIYSVAIKGHNASLLGNVETDNVLGCDSIFSWLYLFDTTIINIGLPHNRSWTFTHHIEEMQKVNYRFHKIFSGYIMDGEKLYFKQYIYPVRKENIITDIEPMFNQMEQEDIVKKQKILGSNIKYCKIKEATKYMIKNMEEKPELLYKERKTK